MRFVSNRRFTGPALAFVVVLLVTGCYGTTKKDWLRGPGSSELNNDAPKPDPVMSEADVDTVSKAVSAALDGINLGSGLGGGRSIDRTVPCKGGGSTSVKGSVAYALVNGMVQANFDLTLDFDGCAVIANQKNVTVESDQGVRAFGTGQIGFTLNGRTVVIDSSLQFNVAGGVGVVTDFISVNCDVDYSQSLLVWGPTNGLSSSTRWQGTICGRELFGGYSS